MNSVQESLIKQCFQNNKVKCTIVGDAREALFAAFLKREIDSDPVNNLFNFVFHDLKHNNNWYKFILRTQNTDRNMLNVAINYMHPQRSDVVVVTFHADKQESFNAAKIIIAKIMEQNIKTPIMLVGIKGEGVSIDNQVKTLNLRQDDKYIEEVDLKQLEQVNKVFVAMIPKSVELLKPESDDAVVSKLRKLTDNYYNYLLSNKNKNPLINDNKREILYKLLQILNQHDKLSLDKLNEFAIKLKDLKNKALLEQHLDPWYKRWLIAVMNLLSVNGLLQFHRDTGSWNLFKSRGKIFTDKSNVIFEKANIKTQ